MVTGRNYNYSEKYKKIIITIFFDKLVMHPSISKEEMLLQPALSDNEFPDQVHAMTQPSSRLADHLLAC